MFKDLFNTTVSLIFRPAEAWRELRERRTDDHDRFLSGYVYPFIGMIALAAFLGVLFAHKVFDLQIALKAVIIALLSSFGGYHVASFLINEMWRSLFRRQKDIRLCLKFVGYASSLMFSLNILFSLLPEFFFLRFLVLFTLYIVWEGAVPFMDVTEAEQFKFAGFSTILIVATPFLLEYILGLLMPGLMY
jgi:cation transport ATPase